MRRRQQQRPPHPDIRAVVDGFHMEEPGIKYRVTNAQGTPEPRRKRVIMNWEHEEFGGLF